jgi:ribonuclease HI
MRTNDEQHLATDELPVLPPVTIYTDGACAGNPGRGGWAYVLVRDGGRTEASGANPDTTNNRMELQAAIEALRALPKRSEVVVITDSEYVAKGMTEWIRGWKTNGWRTAARKPVMNRLQWEKLDCLCQQHEVVWRWVRGHTGDPDNERCDHLAKQQAGMPEGVDQWSQHRKQMQSRHEKKQKR